ncbi:alcohol dehydrogenase catalytic domain-containing protein [Aphanizomenon flos-aquae NRERC-008]|jgi:threonine dehydrogenase-like Zn-dependent dehydrogenase|uniref:Alcohol dehydrogenase catalytic domain-containing protein n=3 Tax=Aphanizomenon flos-aquae TaxID=1176 RepID=A0ABR8IMG6_APHFL|nr:MULTISPECIES: alcohol dehydrogenase catalytic domain-containing protein [Aphanizomenon]MBD1216186.1 alcohol dehydrogenase catalytic domain-containing protein [Aphanizomenon flos-aquae Clear-A1]MBD2391302.1 alcohol dehydrogenase catalytic domain-containing protein [Aphanizomenon flos-aquae FACHB-1171]MBD2558366.1 alcohol dehydrogenase catalytic domain-containing protein [Aphanizomenon flos-aquae FACHB-1290]MBD2630237.1 alcohol dehydrogenase catalytic domain-containing protein [Aphanizomenon s
MKGLWLENNQLQLRTDIPLPEPPAGEALVRVLQAGICNTDLELIKGYYPYTGVIGHEFVGVVEQGPKQLINQRVVGEINAACGNCRFCDRGQPRHCENRTVLGIVNRHGAFAEYLSLPIKNLHLVPENVSTAAATFTEPIAAALEIQQQIQICKNDRVLVVGDGKLGQLIAQTLALTGCELLVIGRHQEKLVNLAARGIKTGLANSVTDKYFDISIDCTGNPEGFNIARRALRPRGTLILKSTYAGNLSLDASSLVVDEITLIGSRCGPFAPALELLATGKVEVQSLIHAYYPLSQGLEAFEKAKTKGVLKVLLEINS